MGGDVGQLSADEVRAVVDQLPVAVILHDAGAVVRYLNPAAEAVLGLTQDAVGQDGMALGVAPSDTSTALEIMESLIAGRPWHGRFPITRRDGTRFLGTFVAAPFRDRGGVPVGYLAVCTDPVPHADHAGAGVEADQTAELLAQAEEANLLLESVLASAPVGLAVFDRGLRYVRANAELAAMNGIPAEDHIGRRLTDVLTRLPEEVPRDIASVFETGEAIVGRQVVGETPARPGVIRTWEASYYPVRLRGEVRWVGVIAIDTTEKRAAEAERARLLVAERRARAEAESAARRLAHLQAVTAGLAESRTPEEVAAVVVEVGTLGLEAPSGALYLLAEDGQHLELVRQRGYHQASVEPFRRLPLDLDLPASEAVRTGELTVVRSLDERDTRYPVLHGVPSNNEALAVVPLTVGHRRLGVIAVGWTEPRELTDADRQFLLALGQQAAQALDRARSLEAEHQAARRQAFLAEASRVLGSSLDYHATLVELARLAVPEAADWCSVHVLEGAGASQAAVATLDPDAKAVLAHLGDATGAGVELQRLADEGRPVLVSDVSSPPPGIGPAVGAVLARLPTQGMCSLIAAPMQARRRSIGILLLGTSSSGRQYREPDLPFVLDLAARAAVAIDNARSHRAREEVARTLQRSLLPPKAPLVPGVEVAARYRPVGDGSEMGGDFYDAFPIDRRRWGLVIGDVSGKGVLAASVTALARYTVRAEARRATSPAAVLASLNRHMLDHDTGERFCTIAHAFVEPLAERVRVTLSVGGHPLPIRLSPEGDVGEIGRPGTAVGLFPAPSLHDDTLVLAPGELLVLFTDGILEARGPDGRFADGMLETTLAAAAGGNADSVADAVEEAVLAFQGGRPRDDMALLVLRVPARRFHHRLAPSSEEVVGARRALARWLVEEAGIDGELVHRIPLVATELVTNAIRTARTAVELRAWADTGEFVLDVSDDGPGFEGSVPLGGAPPDPEAERGRGLFIVRYMSDDCSVQTSPSGTLMRCRVRLPVGA